MPSSIIEICNSALTKVGASAILSLDDNNKEARACKLRYPAVKRIVLRCHPWNCAIGRVSLAQDVAVPPFGFSNQFTLPSDSLRVLDVGPCDICYRIEGRKIMANGSELQLKYIRNVANEADFDDLLAEAIACYLGWDIAYKVTQADDARDAIWKQYVQVLRLAKSVDAQEERDYELEADLLVDSRVSNVARNRSNR